MNTAIPKLGSSWSPPAASPVICAAIGFSAGSGIRGEIQAANRQAGELLGFGSYGTFRAWPAYKYSVEHSVYVAPSQQGRGVGKQLMQRLIQSATEQELHSLIGGIDASNASSIAFHQRLGFVHAGTIKEAGFKFGRWLDVAFYQLLLDTPAAPVDG